MQERAARAIDGARVFTVEGKNVVRAAGRVVQINVRQAFPPAPDADDLAARVAGSINHCLDDGIQAGNVAATGENPNAFCRHDCSFRI